MRDSLRLRAGDAIELDSTGDDITLRPVREKALLVKEQGVWVYYGEGALLADCVQRVSEEIREERERELLG